MLTLAEGWGLQGALRGSAWLGIEMAMLVTVTKIGIPFAVLKQQFSAVFQAFGASGTNR